MEIFDLEDLLKKENFRILVVNGGHRMFFKGDINRFRDEGYDVSEIDFTGFSTLKDFAARFYRLSPNYALLNFRDFQKATNVGRYLTSETSLSLCEGPSIDIAVVDSSDDLLLSRSICFSMARRYWRYDFDGFIERAMKKKPHDGFVRHLYILSHKLEHLWDHLGFESDEGLWLSFIVNYGLAVGLGDQHELTAKLEALYSFVYGEDLRDSVYHSDGSTSVFSGN